MISNRRRAVRATVLVLALLTAGACAETEDIPVQAPQPAAKNKTVAVASFDFAESEIVANLYAGALRQQGYTVDLRPHLGKREIVLPALEKGEVHLVPEYVGTLLEQLAKPASEASSDLDASLAKLRDRLKPKGLTALQPAEAFDANAIVVTRATADKHNLKKVSDLAQVDDQLTFGGPPECPERPLCLLGLKEKYGLEFKQVERLDAGGPITREALKGGRIDVALLFSSDGSITKERFVVLQDDKGLQPAENIVPVIRTDVLDADIERALNAVSEKLTTDELIRLNAAVDIDKEDPADVAEQWLADNGFS